MSLNDDVTALNSNVHFMDSSYEPNPLSHQIEYVYQVHTFG